MSVVFLAAHTFGPLAFLALWLGAARWVAVDARARLRNPSGARAAVIAAAVVPCLGAFLWLCMRPPETLVQRRERRLWQLLLEEDVRSAAPAEVNRVVPLEPKRDRAPLEIAEQAAAV